MSSTESHMFTLGTAHHDGPPGAFVWVTGCDAEQARDMVVALRGTAWAFQYSNIDMWNYLRRHASYCVQTVAVTNPTIPLIPIPRSEA